MQALEVRVLLSATDTGLFATPMFVDPNGGLLGSPHATASPTGYSPAQFKRAYGLDNLKFNGGTVVGDGAGTTIAIVNAFDSPNIANDLHQFSLYYGLPEANFTKIDQYGGTNYPTTRNSLWITEVAIDVEWAHAIAPKANIVLVEANSNSYTDLMTAVNTARNYPGVVAVSMSWGGSEFVLETSYDSYFTTPAGHTGVTFVASSGDTGAPSTFPSVSPNVVAVGGTTLQIDSSGNWINETAWTGSGGGISIYEAQPAYQAGRVTQSTTKRTTPDVAYDAYPGTGVPVYDSYNNGTVTPWSTWGGTSISAPQWAGIFSIVAQGRMLAGKGSMDGATETLPALYSLPSYAFHDVVSGTSTGTPNYAAGPGYDLATGLGTPIGGFVVPQLVGQTSNVSDVRMMSATADGKTTFTITYSIDNKAVTSPVPIAVYLSSDSSYDGDLVDTLLSTVTITDPVDLSLGIHTKTFTIGTGPGQITLPGAGAAEAAGDYYLLTVADPANTVAQPIDNNNVAVFTGTYHSARSGVYVQGGATADTVTIFGISSVTVNGVAVSYTSGDVTGVYVRTHEGDDTIDGSTSSFLQTIYGGAGNDTIKVGTAANTISGGIGINTLSAGSGANTFLISPRTVSGTDKDSITTGTGSNTLSMTSFTNGVSFSLQGTTAQTADSLTGYQIDVSKAKLTTVLLGSGNDTVTGNATLATYIDGGLGNNTLTGGAGNDTLVGGIGNDRLVGGGGNDAYFPGLGSNTIDGSAAGSDTYNFAPRSSVGSDTDTIIANTTGANVLSFSSFTNGLTFSVQPTASQLADHLTGYRLAFSAGTFSAINLGSGDDNVTGNATVGTTINGGAGNNTLTGGTGNDTLIGGSGNDTLNGMGGNDSFNAGLGINVLNGNAAGNSTYTLTPRTVSGSDSDTVIGNTTGTNTLSFSAFTNGLTFSLQATGIQTADVLTQYKLDVSRGIFKTILLGSGDDTVTGNASVGTTINAGNGNNVITGGTGNDSLTAGTGNDTLIGMGGNDSFNGGLGTNTLNGSGAGNSTFSFTARTVAGSDRDTVIANTTGTNSLLFSTFVNGLNINLQAAGVQTVDSLTGYQVDVSRGLYKTILLGSGSDTFTGNASVGTYINGGNGNNIITGGSGNDSLIGGSGNDTIIGMGGNDSFTGGTGSNILDGSGAGNDTFTLAARTTAGSDLDTVIGNLTGNNTLSFSTFTNGLTFSLQSTQNQLADSITGYSLNVGSGSFTKIVLGSGNDVVTGNATVGTNINGGNGNNTLIGGTGNDTLIGGTGNDTLIASGGTDSLTGGLGDDTYVIDTSLPQGNVTITEASSGGTDTLDFSQSIGLGVTVDLASSVQQTVNSNMTLTLSAGNVFENVIGTSQNDVLTGNSQNNLLSGGDGDDTLISSAGNDTLSGGGGNDTYVFNSNALLGSDTIIEAIGAGTDTLDFSQTTTQTVAVDLSTSLTQTVNSNLTLTLSSGDVMENVVGGALGNTLTGNSLDNVLTGGLSNDTLTGSTGNDTLIGGGGSDTLSGGDGNDTYVFNTNNVLGSDTILEASGGGTDTLDFSQTTTQSIVVDLSSTAQQTVNANLKLTLSAGNVIENLTGGALADTLTGNSLNNVISGGDGNDVINGGIGNDTLSGGLGNDTYVFNVNGFLGSDSIVEAPGGGTDTLDFSKTTTQPITIDLSNTAVQGVNANLNLTLSSGTSIENVIGGAFGNTLIGNSLDNVLTGGAGNDTLNGGSGNDTLAGGDGNDTYVFNSNTLLGSDTIVEAAGGGTDTLDFSQTTTQSIAVDLSSTAAQAVNANLTLTLSSGNAIENVTGGTLANVLTGNALDNVLTGGAGNDTLTGGAGNDTLIGAAGNDTYVFNTNTPLGNDTIIEVTSAGTDTLDFSQTTTQSVILDLSSTAAQVVNSNLTLSLSAGNVIENAIGGSLNNILTGNLLDNVLTGGAGNDTLTGGAGNDTLLGNAGDDSYLFNTDSPLGSDLIVEAVNGGTDTLDFSQSTTAVGPVDLASTSAQVVNSNLTITLAASNVIETAVGITEVPPVGSRPVGPILALPQIYAVSATADGKTTFTLTYNIDIADVSGSFNLGIYISGDTAFDGSDALLSTVTISAAEDLTVGTHTKTWTIGNGPGQIALPGAGVAEVAQDYYLLAVADPTAAVSTVIGSNNTAVFVGSYHAPSGGIYVQGSANADTVTVFGYTSVTINGVATPYTLADVSGVFIRTHDGNDTIDASTSSYVTSVYGGAGNDTIKTGSAANFISGGTGVNSITTGNGNSTFLISPRSEAGLDKDTIVTGVGSNTLSMANFTNDVTLSLQSTTAQTVDATTGYQMDLTKARVTTILLGSGNNTATGNASIATYIAGGSGDNTLTGGSGNDTLVGGSGNNTLTGMAGNDTYILAQRTVAGSALDTIVGNTTGTNTLSFASFTNNLTINLQSTTPQTIDALTGYRIDVTRGLFKTLLLGSGDDVVTGNASVGTTINAGDGNNTVVGGLGNDNFTGGSGNDTFTGVGGNDTFAPGTGSNYMNASQYGIEVFNLSPRTVPGSDLDTIITALNGVNTLSFTSFSDGLTVNLPATGPQVVDSLTGYQLDISKAIFKTVLMGSGNDTVFGNTTLGTTINGGEGNNILIGGSGNDTLIGGGSGRSILIGGLGTDSLQGGSGDDILITGTSTYSNNLTALLAIQKEWTSSDSYPARIASLRAFYSLGLNLNGIYYLTSSTITIGTTGEKTLGNGGTDWFWGNLLDTTDRVTTTETLN